MVIWRLKKLMRLVALEVDEQRKNFLCSTTTSENNV
jgi:hypothetical protein